MPNKQAAPRSTKTEDAEREELPLSQATEYVLEEARMVLPGMQALFGFQLIAVFSPGFDEKLTGGERRLHLLAIGLVALAIGLVMTPAAYHRQTGTRRVTADFIQLSTRLLLWSLVALGLGLSVEFFLVAAIIAGRGVAAWSASALLLALGALWFGLPRLKRR